MFKNLLFVSDKETPKLKILKKYFRKHKYKVFNFYTYPHFNKEAIKNFICKNSIDVILFFNISYKQQSKICHWFFNEYPTKLYFSVIESVSSIKKRCKNCSLFMNNRCKAVFLYYFLGIDILFKRFKFLGEHGFMSRVGELQYELGFLLDKVTQYIGVLPLFKEETQMYAFVENIKLIVENWITYISNFIVSLITEKFHADKISLFIYNIEIDNFVLVASYGYEITEQVTQVKKNWDLIQNVIKNKKPLLIHDGVLKFPKVQRLKTKQPELVSSIVYPLCVGEVVIGVLNVASKDMLFSYIDFQLIRILARWVSYIFYVMTSFKSSFEYEKLKTDFISIINHELRTPLMALSASTELLEGQIPSNIEDIIKRNIKRLDSLIQEMLDFSRIGKGTFKIEVKEESISAFIKEIIEEYRALFENYKINFIYNINTTTDKSFFDKNRLKQVITNLLNNSIKFVDETKTDKYVKIELNEEEKYFHFIVEDNGIGIKKENFKKIFLPFFQIGDIMTKSKPGAGLGLYISKEIISQHRGKMWCESEYGKYTRFHILLPKQKINGLRGG